MRYLKLESLCIIVIIYLTNLTLGDEPRIIIIGAGPSGIAAASKLYENGFNNITILEAEDRIGGRIHTTTFGDGLLELGAQWVHGETDNIVFELASILDLLEIPEEDDVFPQIYSSDGHRVPTSISNKFFQFWDGMYTNSSVELKGHNGSSGDYFMARMTAEAENFPEVNETFIRPWMKLAESLTQAEDASDSWYNTSARGYTENIACPGNHHIIWKERGYNTILDILMGKYPNPENELPVMNNTILNAEVKNIDYDSIEGKVLIELNNGQKYEADHVVVTPSLGVLKEQYETLFTPQLPEPKIKTIKGLEMGTVGKLFLSFEEAWWPSDTAGFAFLWNERDREEYKNDPHKKWLLDQLGIFTLKQRPLILRCWLNGPGVRYMETLSEDEVINQTMELVEKFLGKSYNVTRPTGLLRSTWYSNKHFRGTYSYRSMASEEADVWADDLAAPLNTANGQPLVMFAGEATHAHYYSTVHGAIETGYREANRLIDVYKNTLNP